MLQDTGLVKIVPMAIGQLLPARHHEAGGVQEIPVPIVPEPTVLQNTGPVKIIPMAVRQPLPAGNMAAIFIIVPLSVFLMPAVTNWSGAVEVDGNIGSIRSRYREANLFPRFLIAAIINVLQICASIKCTAYPSNAGRDVDRRQIVHFR